MPNSTPSRPCLPRARCHNWRTCDICARIRQAKIADAAERLQLAADDLTWTCLSPADTGARELAKARDAFLRAEEPIGAIWTVEMSPQTGRLHCNILHPTTTPRSMRLARVWQAPLTGNARAVAAYISKRSQMPAKELYPGRLYGTAGPLWQWLAGGDAPAPVAAAKTQYDIDPAPLSARSGITERNYLENRDYTWDDYRAIAAARLPDLLRAAPLLRVPRDRQPHAEPAQPERPSPQWPIRDSRRVRWLTRTLRPYEIDWKPKSAR